MAELKNGPTPSLRSLSSNIVPIMFLVWGALGSLWAGPTLVSSRRSVTPQPPPIQHLPPTRESAGPKPLGVTPYSIGQPTDEEQLYLEYLNRMRADPTAEGQRLATTTDPSVVSAYGD